MAYTVEQVAVLNKAAENGPITYAQACEIAELIGMSQRSVVAKIKSLDLAYEPKPAEPKRPKGMTKADLIASIKARLDKEDLDLSGLEKATSQALGKLVEAL